MSGKITSVFCFLAVAFFAQPGNAQNLVLNSGFEDFSVCPDNIDQMDYADFWKRTTDGSSDYFNSCSTAPAVSVPENGSGFAFPFDGDAYAGIMTYANPDVLPAFAEYREYVTGMLSEPLIPSQLYTVRFRVTKGENFQYATGNFSAYLSTSDPSLPGTGTNWPPLGEAPHSLSPQINYTGSPIADTAGWVVIEDTFLATGGEEYITIGNFNGSASTDTMSIPGITNGFAFYYIDGVELEAVPYAPVLADDYAFTTDDVSIWIDVLANDVDFDGVLDPSSMFILATPTDGSVNIDVTGEILYEPVLGTDGVDSFEYRVCDNDGLCGTASVFVTVVPAPVGPDAIDDNFWTLEETSIVADVLFNDIEGDFPIDYSTLQIVTAPANGSATLDSSPGNILYLPDAGFLGEDIFTYSICDESALCDTAEIRIVVSDVPPTICLNDTATLQGLILAVDVLGNDISVPDGWDLSSLVIDAEPMHGTASISSGATVVYRLSQPLNSSNDFFTYSVCDVEGNCSSAEVYIINEMSNFDITVPAAITPNTDGKNDVLNIKNLDQWPGNQLHIFNRREQLVFQAVNYSNNWNAEGLPEGTYFYILDLTPGMSSGLDQSAVFRGTISVIRDL